MIDVSFDYYTNTYKGSSVENAEDFNALEQKTILFLDSIAPADIIGLKDADLDTSLTYKYKMCICNMVDTLYNIYEGGVFKGVVKSEKVGAWTTTYAIKEGTTTGLTLSNIANMYLSGTKLMCAWC